MKARRTLHNEQMHARAHNIDTGEIFEGLMHNVMIVMSQQTLPCVWHLETFSSWETFELQRGSGCGGCAQA